MSTRADILAMAQAYSGLDTVKLSQGYLFGPKGMEGDDADEFLDAFSKEFGVDLSDFVHYFHYDADEPPIHRRVEPVDATGQAFPLIPIHIDQLVHAAASGKWQMAYPAHTVRNNWWRLFGPLPWFFGAALLTLGATAILC